MRSTILAMAIGAAAAAACGGTREAAKPAGGNPFEHFATLAPRVGDPAPAFALTDVNGETVRLSDATARGPVVLVFGSFS